MPLRVHLGLYDDETAALCHWHVPEAHYLESWSDARAADGTVTIVQPLIAPLYGGRSAHEVVGAMRVQAGRAVGLRHRPRLLAAAQRPAGRRRFDKFWRKALHDGRGGRHGGSR